MKTIAFVFQNKETSQIEWALKHFINDTHQIILIFIKSQKFFIINEPFAMLSFAKLLIQDNDTEKEFLNSAKKMINSTIDVEIGKIVLCGDERYKLNACLCALNIDIVILGPDSEEKGIGKFVFKSLSEFISCDLGIPVIKVPKIVNKNI